MLRRLILAATLSSLVASAVLSTTASGQAPSEPALETALPTLDAAVHCPQPLANLNRDPVLLVPGTGLGGNENWDWGYGPALQAAGFAYCTVDLRDFGMADIQVSAEHVVYAIRKLALESGRDVAVIGYSQGGIEVRWALRYWPSLRQSVSDFIGLAAAHHGADTAAAFCDFPTGCGPSIKQMVRTSRLLAALDKGAQVWAPVDYTSIYSTTDGVNIPPAVVSTLPATPGVNVSNVAIQSICPANATVHIGMPADGVAFAVVLDALLRPGPGDGARISNDVCTAQPYVPGVTAEEAAAKAEELNNLALGRILPYPAAAAEPPLKSYAVADAAPATPVAPGPPSTGSGTQEGSTRLAWLAALLLLAAVPAGAAASMRARQLRQGVRRRP